MSKDSQEKAAGAGVTITLNGKDYEIQPFKVGDYVALRSYIRSQRIKNFRENAEGLEPAMRAQILIELSSQIIGEQELLQEAVSASGMVFMLWRALYRTDPSLQMEDMMNILDDQSMDDLEAIAEGINLDKEVPVNPPVPSETEIS